MRAILLNSFRSSPYISKIPIPKPIAKTPCALIKVKASQANPSDFAMIGGIYSNKEQLQFPTSLGLQGSGIIEQIYNTNELISKQHNNFKLTFQEGQHVSFRTKANQHLGSGAWGEYCIVPLKNMVPMDRRIPFKYLAGAIVNPVSALYAFQLVKRHLSKEQNYKKAAIIQSGASSSVGRILSSLCANEGIRSYNLVRGQHNVDIIKEQNIYSDQIFKIYDTLNYQSLNVYLKNDMNQNVKPIVAFDCIGGKISDILFKSLKQGGSFYSYGVLSLKPMDIKFDIDFIFQNLTIKSLLLSKALDQDQISVMNFAKTINDDLKLTVNEQTQNQSIFKAKIGQIVSFIDFQEAIRQHKKKMSDGKVVITF